MENSGNKSVDLLNRLLEAKKAKKDDKFSFPKKGDKMASKCDCKDDESCKLCKECKEKVDERYIDDGGQRMIERANKTHGMFNLTESQRREIVSQQPDSVTYYESPDRMAVYEAMEDENFENVPNSNNSYSVSDDADLYGEIEGCEYQCPVCNTSFVTTYEIDTDLVIICPACNGNIKPTFMGYLGDSELEDATQDTFYDAEVPGDIPTGIAQDGGMYQHEGQRIPYAKSYRLDEVMVGPRKRRVSYAGGQRHAVGPVKAHALDATLSRKISQGMRRNGAAVKMGRRKAAITKKRFY